MDRIFSFSRNKFRFSPTVSSLPSLPLFPKFEWNFPRIDVRLDRLSENYRDVFIFFSRHTKIHRWWEEEQGLSNLCDGNGFAGSDEKKSVRKFTGTDS